MTTEIADAAEPQQAARQGELLSAAWPLQSLQNRSQSHPLLTLPPESPGSRPTGSAESIDRCRASASNASSVIVAADINAKGGLRTRQGSTYE